MTRRSAVIPCEPATPKAASWVAQCDLRGRRAGVDFTMPGTGAASAGRAPARSHLRD